MTPKFRPTYWQLESSSMQYIIRERQHKEVVVENCLLGTCTQDVEKECTCITPSVFHE